MPQQVTAAIAVGTLSLAGTVATEAVPQRPEAGGGRHIATMHLADGRTVGTVRFTPTREGTRVSVSLWLLSGFKVAEGITFRGFHVHANDDPANGSGCVAEPAAAPTTWFVSTNGHLNLTGADHGDHTGDLPVVFVQEDGDVRAMFVTDRFDPHDVEGRAVRLHALPGNYVNISNTYTPTGDAAVATARTGDAGFRLACGVVR